MIKFAACTSTSNFLSQQLQELVFLLRNPSHPSTLTSSPSFPLPRHEPLVQVCCPLTRSLSKSILPCYLPPRGLALIQGHSPGWALVAADHTLSIQAFPNWDQSPPKLQAGTPDPGSVSVSLAASPSCRHCTLLPWFLAPALAPRALRLMGAGLGGASIEHWGRRPGQLCTARAGGAQGWADRH